ncbi:MAG: 2,3-bisphosphoglycerate-independent phosphoglycerate mutase [Syntrophus sp. SKADARSKE-3]|nr:2,3-bisphosphoglycerate-independent phosphoglycerate mutase [Syntrophus sp. SKADARSKE-3]
MKFIVLLGDGMADYAIPELGGMTPTEHARTPNMDRMAAEGTLGLVDTIPAGLKPGSDVANLTVLGYDALKLYSGRGPLEAANMGITLGPDDVAFRCNLVSLGNEEDPLMDDFTAGHISTREATDVIKALNNTLGNDTFSFYPGVGYRHLLIWHGGKADTETTPPHDITGQPTTSYLPRGEGSNELLGLMNDAKVVLKGNAVNRERQAGGKKTANSIWLWGQGRAPRMEKLTEKYGFRGGMISAVDLLNGIGIYAGLKVVRVPGATGYTDTNYVGKAEYALEALKSMDFVFIHVEAPDEMGHEGNIEGKIKAIEDFDEKVVGTVMEGAKALGPVRILVLSDHPTPIAIKTHASDPSPFAVWSSINDENLNTGKLYGETNAAISGILIKPGFHLMELFIARWRDFIEEHR